MALLLDVRDLRVSLPTARGRVEALRGVDLQIERGETLGLIGESGCGKSLTALALMGLLPAGAQVSGRIDFDGQPLARADEATWCGLRGQRIAMVFQEPMTALNPLQPIGRQVGEALRRHRGLSAAAARAEALRALDRVQLPQAAQRLDDYPHQLSGGQRQRVMIAAALACGPELLIADEPTTALDVTLQREILALLTGLIADSGMALLLISHDLGVMAQTVAGVMVMYAGRVVDEGPTGTVFERLVHPYTRGLFGARPRLGGPRGQRLVTIPGRVPGLHEAVTGCAFADRCERVVEGCRADMPTLEEIGDGHSVRCIRPWDHAKEAPSPSPAGGRGSG